jgi:Fur family transcriptional regulator, ferric uptake regulator
MVGDDGKAQAGTPPSSPNVGRLREQLETYMEKRGLRSTGQRRLIFQCFFDSSGHVTIDELLAHARKSDPGIGYATVYRTMKMLTAGGVAHEHKFSDGMTRYELADEEAHHDHLICVECGRIQEFEEPLIEELQQRIAERFGFEIIDHKHELYGVCQKQDCEFRKAKV